MIKLIRKLDNFGEDLPFFAQEKYLQTVSDNYGWFISETFILPFLLYKNFIMKRIVFTNETIELKPGTIEEEQKFLDEVIAYIKKNKICDFIYKPAPSAIFRTYPKNSDSFRAGSYIITPQNNIEEMINKITSASQRTHTRKAIKIGVVVEPTDDWKLVYDLCEDTLSRQNIQLGINKEEFYKQFKTLHPQNMLMFKATYAGKVEAVTVIFNDKINAYSQYTGRIERPQHGLVRLLNLCVFKYLVDNFDIKNFDFIGAVPDIIEDTKEGKIQKFKEEFGSTMRIGYQFRMIINPIRYSLFNKLITLKFKLKKIDYIDPVERDKLLSKTNLKV